MSYEPFQERRLRERVWGPSVPHELGCHKAIRETLPCDCPKRLYCEGCDAQHGPKQKCPRTVLDQIAEAVEFSNKGIKALISEILEAAEARAGNIGTPYTHIESRIAELVDRYGNLGMTRKRLYSLVKKEMLRRWRREARRDARQQREVALIDLLQRDL